MIAFLSLDTLCTLHHFSRVQLLVTLWTAAHQAPLSMGFSRQEYWSGLPCPPPEDLPDPGIEPGSPALQVVSVLCGSLGKLWFVLETLIKNQLSQVYPLASGVAELPWCFLDGSCISPIAVSIFT